MQAKKTPRLIPAPDWAVRSIEGFCSALGTRLGECAPRPIYILEVPGGPYVEAFSPPPTVAKAAHELFNNVVYSIGGYLGNIDRKTHHFNPSLPLAHRLARLCGSIRCCALDSRGERKFLYGKPVAGEYVVSSPCTPGPCVVVNRIGEALGWGSIRVKSKRRCTPLTLQPVKDLGWYLRRGG